MACTKLLRDSSGLVAKKQKKNTTLLFVIGGNFKGVVGEGQAIGMVRSLCHSEEPHKHPCSLGHSPKMVGMVAGRNKLGGLS